jgi:hypothetical protein
MGTKSCVKSWGATTCARAALGIAFKACCRNSGRYDGVERSYYF